MIMSLERHLQGLEARVTDWRSHSDFSPRYCCVTVGELLNLSRPPPGIELTKVFRPIIYVRCSIGMQVTGKSAEVPSHAGEIFPKEHSRKASE